MHHLVTSGRLGSRVQRCEKLDMVTLHYGLTFVILAIQLPLYTLLMVYLMLSERQDIGIQKLFFMSLLQVSIHLVLYIAEVAVRAPHVPWYLIVHHILWLCFYLIPPVF